MSDSIFKAVVTHFENDQTQMRFGNMVYEIYPSHGSSVCYIRSRIGGEREYMEMMGDFDSACGKIALEIEEAIVKHWSGCEL